MHITQRLRFTLLVGLAFATLGSTRTSAKASPPDCSNWALDGYRLGMPGDEMLALRSVTLHVDGQAQVVVPGRFRGVLALDRQSRLESWGVTYDAHAGDQVRAALFASLGTPASDLTGDIINDEQTTVRQRRTIWWGDRCDAAIILYENTTTRGGAGHTVSANLTRASRLNPGLIKMKILLP